jgi:hypothetical protein
MELGVVDGVQDNLCSCTGVLTQSRSSFSNKTYLYPVHVLIQRGRDACQMTVELCAWTRGTYVQILKDVTANPKPI